MGAHRYGIFLGVFNSIISHKWDQERVICQLQHTKRNSISTCKQPACIILFKYTDDIVFDNFLKISDHFRNISKGFQNDF